MEVLHLKHLAIAYVCHMNFKKILLQVCMKDLKYHFEEDMDNSWAQLTKQTL